MHKTQCFWCHRVGIVASLGSTRNSVGSSVGSLKHRIGLAHTCSYRTPASPTFPSLYSMAKLCHQRQKNTCTRYRWDAIRVVATTPDIFNSCDPSRVPNHCKTVEDPRNHVLYVVTLHCHGHPMEFCKTSAYYAGIHPIGPVLECLNFVIQPWVSHDQCSRRMISQSPYTTWLLTLLIIHQHYFTWSPVVGMINNVDVFLRMNPTFVLLLVVTFVYHVGRGFRCVYIRQHPGGSTC